ncbi:MAG: hypothetical protein HPY50_08925 [Firmicutes bacterium]|nr:hypothetical protein [Bacillota bacterium]
MFNQYFGNYLLEKKIITPEQLRIVLEEKKSIKVKLGVLAIDAGYMNAEQVNRIHKLQTARDKKFGELAIDEGYLTEEMLDNLLKEQRKSNVLLGQVLIEKGFFTFEKYEAVLLQYNEDSEFSLDEIKALKNNDAREIAGIFLKAADDSNDMFHNYLELFIRNLVRFIDDEIKMEAAKEIDSYVFDHFITQRMEAEAGRHHLFTGFTGSENTLARFASIYAAEECNGMDDLAKDSLKEFMNCQNGLFLSNLSHKGVEMELYLSEVKENGTLKATKKMYMIPCNLSFGRINLVFSDEFPNMSFSN